MEKKRGGGRGGSLAGRAGVPLRLALDGNTVAGRSQLDAAVRVRGLEVADVGGVAVDLGVVAADEGTTEAGLRVLDLTVRSWGAPMEGVVLADASGLSTDNRLTCDTLIGVLNHLEQAPTVDGLPVAGRSGTLIDEFLGTPVEGELRAKTGTLSNPPDDADPPEVKALAGYLDAPNGDVLEFALVLNGPGYVTADGYISFWSALAERLADHPTGPSLRALGPR